LYLNVFSEVVETCSIFAASGTATQSRQTFLGMNTDESRRTEKTQVVLQKEPDDGYRFIGNAFAGVVTPFHGMNQKGLAIASMLLNVIKPAEPVIGMPLVPILDLILSQCTNVDDAIKLFEKLPHPTYGLALFFADKTKVARIETVANEYDIKTIQNSVISCCMIPQSEKIKKYDATLDWNPRMTINAIPRTKRMHQLLTKYNGHIDLEVMMTIARDHGEGETKGKSICQHSLGAVTIGSFIAKPQDLKIWMCQGRPCKKNYTEFTP